MPNFADMSADEQKALCTKVAECLKANDLASVPVTIYREEVCQLTGNGVEGKLVLKVEKQLPSTQQAKAEKFNEEIKDITAGIEGVSVSVNSVVGPGDMYQTITNVTTLDDETPVNIEHKQGEVMMIDFWATWCPPCQAPMAHNHKMLADHGATWGDRVKIIGLSIDKDAATVKNHVTKKDWTNPIHYWRSKSNCSDVYAVRGVPHVLIIDTNGKIVFKGHPANRKDLVQDFNDLLEGKELTGEGCAPAEPKADADRDDAVAELPEGYKQATEADVAAIQEEMTAFRETGKQLQAEAKEDATGMMRNFCVLVLQARMEPATMGWATKYENYRVLVGPQAKIDACNGKIQAKLAGGSFTVNEQFHPM